MSLLLKDQTLTSQALTYQGLVIYLCLYLFSSADVYAQEDKPRDEIANTSLQVTFAVDYNRDGKIEFPPNDELFKPTLDSVSPQSPYVFWLNDDDDKHNDETDGNDVPGTKSSFWGMSWAGEYNYKSSGIDGTRDLNGNHGTQL
jgi:hypothetical protein